MKMLWYRIILMLRCWKLLVPLKMATGFEDVVTSWRSWCPARRQSILVPQYFWMLCLIMLGEQTVEIEVAKAKIG
jgi:hypothetical protein